MRFAHAETPMPIFFLDCFSWNRYNSGHIHKQMSHFQTVTYTGICVTDGILHTNEYLIFRQKEPTVGKCLLNTDKHELLYNIQN